MNTRSSTRMRVRQVADELLAKGTKPTVALVRAETGGSDTTVSDELQRWWAGLGKRLMARQALPGVPDALATPVNELWAAALDLAKASLEQQREALETQFQQARAELEQSLEQANTQRDEALTRVESIHQEMGAEAKRRTDAERLAGETQGRLAEKENLIEEMTAAAERTAQALNELKTELTTERIGREGDTRHWAQQLDAQRQSAKELTKRVTALETRLAQSEKHAAIILRERETIETRLTSDLEHTKEKLRESEQQAAERQETLRAAKTAIEEKLTGMRVDLGVAQSRAAEAEKQLAAANKRIERLLSTIASLKKNQERR